MRDFTISDTNFAKGLALCLLLIHHLFYDQSSQYIDFFINGRGISNLASEFSKVCVAMFLFLSGYGLTESTAKKTISIISFYKRHLSKLYINYWLMWIIFVPMGVLFFDRTFTVVFGDNMFFKFMLNILGLQYLFGFYGYNPAWWFMSSIIPFYVFFPLIKKFIGKYKKWSLFAFFALIYVGSIPDAFRYWLFPFALGVYFSQNNMFHRFKIYMEDKPIKKLFAYLSIIILIMILRHYAVVPLRTLALDGIFGLFIILVGFEYISKNELIKRIMVFIGKHSFNIYLFHSFIYGFYFQDFIYLSKYPPVIFLQLLLLCLFISVLIEKVKTVISIPVSIGSKKTVDNLES